MKRIFLSIFVAVSFDATLHTVQTYVHVGSLDQIFQSNRQKKKLFKKVGCTYMNDMRVKCHDCLVNPYSTSYFLDDADTIRALSERYHDDVIQKKLAPMYLKFISAQVGYGIFATKAIQKGDFVGVYAGDLRLVDWNSKAFKEDVDYAWYYTVDSPDGKKMVIDGKYFGNELRFINHANNPNTRRIDVVVDGMFYVCYIATRYIPQDAQLTVSYGDSYWNSRSVDPAKFSD